MNRLIVLQHLERETPGLFTQIAAERNVYIDIYRLDLGQEVPCQINDDDILLVMGGPMSVNDINTPTYPWMHCEIELLKLALRKQTRVIGVCLGAQLLAYAAGGVVEKLSGVCDEDTYEVGWDNVYFLNKNDPFNRLIESPFKVLHWHSEKAILPSLSKVIASNEVCKEQLFRINPFAYGIQFHVEVDAHMIEKWIEEDKEFIFNALGDNAENILRSQQENFFYSTLQNRIRFINVLYDLLRVY